MVHTSSPPLRVLVVEDDSLMRWAIAETLGAAGHVVIEAANAATARRGVTEALDPFDVILLDYLLPDSHDLALLADLRRASPTSAIVLITAKSDAMPDLGNAVSALGASLTLTKPVNMALVEHLVRSVHRAMHRDLRPMVLGCGDHACAIHSDATESVCLAADFIADGLTREERCWYVPDTHTPGTIDRALRQRGIDVESQLRRGALRILSPRETYQRSGSFEPSQTIDLYGEATRHAVQDGFAAFRAVADMSWVLGTADGVERVIAYEAALKRLFATSRATGLCLYNRKRMPLAVLDAVLGTHPIAGLGRAYHANPFYDPGVQALSQADGSAVTAKLQLLNLQ